MRGSRLTIWMYGAMAGVPLLLFILLALNFVPIPYLVVIRKAVVLLLALGLIVLGVTGTQEVFIHKREKGTGMRPGINNIPQVKKEDISRVPGGGEIVTVNMKRYNSDSKAFDVQAFKIKADDLKTVLGALIDIKSYIDPTLSVRYSCRMGICGSCGMVVNGKPLLACEAHLLSNLKDGEITIEPMEGHPLLKDLVTDFDDFFEKHKSVSPQLYRSNEKEKYAAKELYKQTRGQVDKFLPYSFCVMCGLCLDACPVVNSNPNFIGPQALSQAYRYHADSRDEKGAKRLFEIDTLEGVWGCEFAGSCSKACPKGVDPASAIQLLKSEVIKNIANEEEDKDAI